MKKDERENTHVDPQTSAEDVSKEEVKKEDMPGNKEEAETGADASDKPVDDGIQAEKKTEDEVTETESQSADAPEEKKSDDQEISVEKEENEPAGSAPVPEEMQAADDEKTQKNTTEEGKPAEEIKESAPVNENEEVAGTAIMEENVSEAEKPAEEGKEPSKDETAKKEESTPEKEQPSEEIKAPVSEQEATTEEASKEDSDTTQDDNDQEEEEDHEVHLDYHNYSKKQMVQVVESLLKDDNFNQLGLILKEIKVAYDELFEQERKEAYDKYLEEGGEKDGFEFKPEDLDNRFLNAYNTLRERRSQYYNSLERQKEQNLETKQAILEKLREIVDSEETVASMNTLKEIQQEWKSVGPVPSAFLKSLWANYNALIDRFYDQRSIYFELKELDRKKNLEQKIELCEKAEGLDAIENIKEAIKQLNELHEEFKYIGPVPQEDQERVWQRFKTASDKIYAKRKNYYEDLKKELDVNLVAKEALAERVQPFSDFISEKISDWNAKTKEILALQKEWEAIGGLPKEKAKKVNKAFWSAFKTFFNHKGVFFKKIDESRKENLILKQDLLAKAEELKDSDDFAATSEELKKLQRQWKEIGPVPEKNRNEIFQKFKEACDHFFNRRRAQSEKMEQDYVVNLKKKEELCDELEKMQEQEEVDIERIKEIEEQWGGIGYVPRSNIKSIQKRYTEAVSKLVEDLDITDTEKHQLKFSAQFSKAKYGPGSERMIQKKEGILRRQISKLENDINVWKNNIDFFADSKNANKLKEEFKGKIDSAKKELKGLKEQLKMISNI